MQPTRQQAFTKLAGLPLTKTTRKELVQYFHFGHTHYTTPQGLILDVGKLTLAVNCPWQLQLPDGTSIKHSDVYIRKREAGLPTPVWDWKEPGSSFLDQRLTELIKTSAPLVVARVEPQENQGFILSFADGSTLHVAPDPAKPDAEYWKLFSNTDDFAFGAGAETQV
ncbi:hypothetical protein [Pontibacter liquoris]|uniref:hypothetical protein n=1 Tax=Pontibacter liquoris TaxID=2905677 RepID=UPI001FA71AC3|nr:hypothetical protein [Pontibacter liquoris]